MRGATVPSGKVVAMRRLVRFELKKMLSRRVAVVVNVGVILLLTGIMGMNVIQTKTESDDGGVLSGPAAIAYRRAVVEAHAGVLTPERIATDIARYQAMAYELLDADALADLSSEAAYEAAARVYDADTLRELSDPYYRFILRPWSVSSQIPLQYAAHVTPAMALDFYGALADDLQVRLDDGQAGTWTYSEAERAFWTEVEDGAPEPLTYGYTGGWDNILDCSAFIVFAIFAICVTTSPLFAAEYREGTDAVLLAARWGRGRLITAKLIAAFLYATALFALAMLIICGVSFAFYGVAGADLPLQNYTLDVPYGFTMVQGVLLYAGLFYLVMLGMLAFTLALSARVSSTLGIIVADVVLLFVTGALPSLGNGVLRHVLNLFPMGLQSAYDLFASCMSYQLGPVVLDLLGMAAAVYLIAVAAGVPVAWRAWSRHQVA